jgi:hypothetical protein
VLAHLWCPGFGHDSHDGLLAASRRFNSWQNTTVEETIRAIARSAKDDNDFSVILDSVAETWPPIRGRNGDLLPRNSLRRVRYRIQIEAETGRRSGTVEVEIELPDPRRQNNKWITDDYADVTVTDLGTGRSTTRRDRF